MIKTLNSRVYKKILKDSDLSMELATVFGIKQTSVEWLARRKSDKLLNVNAVEVYQKYGLTEDQIFKSEKL